jgi:predicted metalloprotease with PDZ domain
VMEGFTTYYDVILLRRCGFVSARRTLQLLAERVAMYRQIPGRLVQSLAESSMTTWIKFYRPDENTPNSAISYYLKGSLVALMLDMDIRAQNANSKSLDDVMRELWSTYGVRDVGFTEQEFTHLLQEVGEVALHGFLKRFVDGLEELPLEHYFGLAGLTLTEESKGDAAEGWLGLRTVLADNNTVKARIVLRDSPAEAAGLMANDTLVAIDGYQIWNEEFLNARLKEKRVGNSVTLHYFRDGRLLAATATLTAAPAENVSLRPTGNPTSLQMDILESWLETTWEEVR